MDAQTVISLIKILIPIVLALAAYNTYLIFKLKNVDPFGSWDRNKINGALMLVFFVGLTVLTFWGYSVYEDLYILITNPASNHGVNIDKMFWTTMYVTILVFVLTNALLFFFCYKYAGKDGKKALYYPENNKLEIIWTVIPAIVLTILIASGVFTWWEATGEAEPGHREIELTGRQFEWIIRYPGADNKFGKITWDSINDANGNTYGYHFTDKNAHDDFNPTEIHLEVGVPVKVNIRARDVLHSATFPHFRMKMDAVPGMTTSFWFTPTITTDSMRLIKNNPNFKYELACQEICGGGHWNMGRTIVIDTKEQYKAWLNQQKATYAEYTKSKEPAPIAEAPTAGTKTDTTKTDNKVAPVKAENVKGNATTTPAKTDAKSTTPAKAENVKGGATTTPAKTDAKSTTPPKTENTKGGATTTPAKAESAKGGVTSTTKTTAKPVASTKGGKTNP